MTSCENDSRQSNPTPEISNTSHTVKSLNLLKPKKTVKEKRAEDETDLEQVTEATSLEGQDIPNSPKDKNNRTYLTLTGTLKRGKKAGQSVDIKVNITQEELRQLEVIRANEGPNNNGHLSLLTGPFILIWSICISPIIFLLAFVYSFYLGTITWHNILSFYTEEKPFCCRIFSAPLLILSYPFIIIMTTFGLGIYTAISQISYNWNRWLNEVQDLEKGFYAGLCAFLGLEICAPYTEVIITGQISQNP